MVKDRGALRPTFRPLEKAEEVVDIQTISKEEQILAAGSVNEFWQVLKKHIYNSIDQLEQANEQAIATGIPMEEVGKNTIVLSLVKTTLRSLVNKVEDAASAEEERLNVKKMQ